MATITLTVTAGELAYVESLRAVVNKRVCRAAGLPDTATQAQVRAVPGFEGAVVYADAAAFVYNVAKNEIQGRLNEIKKNDLDDFRIKWAAMTPAQKTAVTAALGVPANFQVPVL